MQQAVRDALIAFMAATAAQAEATRIAQHAGIEHAKAKGDCYLGRKPSYTREQYTAVTSMLAQSTGIAVTAKIVRLTRQTIYRIHRDPAAAESALTAWGL
jgi:DNA invertase Pin-like site-specific DNA recombinase